MTVTASPSFSIYQPSPSLFILVCYPSLTWFLSLDWLLCSAVLSLTSVCPSICPFFLTDICHLSHLVPSPPSLLFCFVFPVTVLVPFTQFYVEKDTTFDVTIPITLSSNGGGNTTGGTGGGGAAATGPSTNADDEVIIILSGTAYESSGWSLGPSLMTWHVYICSLTTRSALLIEILWSTSYNKRPYNKSSHNLSHDISSGTTYQFSSQSLKRIESTKWRWSS